MEVLNGIFYHDKCHRFEGIDALSQTHYNPPILNKWRGSYDQVSVLRR